MLPRLTRWVAVLVLGVGLVVGNAQANLVDNGSFSAGLSQWSYTGDVSVGNNSAPGMVGQYALLGSGAGNSASTLSQSFSILGLSQLQVSFDWYFAYTDRAPAASDQFAALLWEAGIGLPPIITYDILQVNSINVGSDPNQGLMFGHFQNTYDLSTWLPIGGAVTFSLMESPSVLTLVSRAGVDNVSVAAPVPEPATLLLLGSGLLGVGGFAWRRRKS